MRAQISAQPRCRNAVRIEKATVRILETLARFENVEALSPETVSQVLLNSELRRRMANDASVSEQIALVKPEFRS